ncbi:MAG TPA: phosphopantetheine-binding protein [Pirellulaceae bacterium]|nr:phosphopantetheine-binding protein [Pirellulaceae bacterium]
MTITDIRPRVKKTIAKIIGLGVDQIGDNASFDVLELDSLSRIELLVELEREFKLDIPEESEDENLIAQIKTVEDAARLVERNLAAMAAA